MDKGAHFHRCDFQVHTPRDTAWSGVRPSTAQGRREFADRLVAACRAKGITAIAITEHHDFSYVDVVRQAAAEERGSDGHALPPEERLVVFPGLELTLGVPCQALLLLDAEFPTERLNTVLASLQVDVVDDSVQVLPSVVRIEHFNSLKQLHEELDRNSWLRGSYIVLPNVTDHGHGTLMRTAMQSKYKEMPCVGGYLDGSVEAIGEGNQKKFAGLDANWGYKPLALFQTSDSRSDTFTDLGKHSTWVKWATPTAEALRQACLAQESRISHVAPALPNLVITRLSVSNSKFMGPIELELNPQYNAIIGGRGTGKSTCLEYLRWALCDQPPHGSDVDEMPDHATRRQRLIEQTLAPFDAHVDVHFVVNGIPHLVRRYANSGDIMFKVGKEELAPGHPDDVRALLPIEAYSQRQLSSVSVRVDELTRFVTAPIRQELADIATRQETLEGQTRANHAELERYRALTRALAADDVTVASLGQQAANLRESLTGVSPEDRRVLDEKPHSDAADQLVAGWRRRLGQTKEATDAFRAAIGRIRSDLRSAEGIERWNDTLVPLESAIRSILDDLERAGTEAQRLLAQREQEDSTIASLLAKWNSTRTAFERDYAGATERSSAHETSLRSLAELERRRRTLQDSIDERREEVAQLGDPTSEHLRLREEWRALQEERSQRIAEQCEALTQLSGGLIRASIRRSGGLRVLADRFRLSVTGTGVRGAKLDDFIDRIGKADHPLAEWDRCLQQLEELIAAESEAAPVPKLTPSALTEAFNEGERAKMASKVTPEAVLGLALTALEDLPSFEYRTKDGEYIAFNVASAGQQATALLRVLLNQPGPPLVIDQPEDDLDSQVVNDVVYQIWAAKARRQLVFSSHNANLVVNGDAELVVCCDYRAAGDQSGGRLKLEGAIDVPDVRKEITVVMEGGERAFRLRKEKYGF